MNESMTRAEYIRLLKDEELILYLYYNKKKTGMGLKKIAEWVNEEVKEEEERNDNR